MASSSRSRPLSKEEQQEEEMRERLKTSPFYYENIPLEEMKHIEEALNNTNDIEAASTSTSEYSTTKNTSDVSNRIPLPNFSYRSEKSNNTKYSPDEQFHRGENKTEYDLMSNKNNLNNENSNSDSESISNSDSESIFNKTSNFFNDDYPPLKNKSSTKHNKEQFQPRENKRIMNQRRNTQDRWRINPLVFFEDENDVPLKQPERVHITNGESLPYLKSDDVDDETFQKLCQQMSEKLDTLHEQFTMGSGDRKWGSPIKATGKWIDSLDKTAPVENPVLRNDYSPEVLFRDTRERATKRKALSNIHAACINDSSDENSEFEFENKKKRKCQQGKKGEERRKNQGSLKSTSRSSPIDMIDVSDSNDVQENLNTNTSVNIEINQEAEYPRRIIPPNPANKKNYKGPRGRKKSTAQSQNSSLRKSLNDEEIQKTLSELTEQINDSDDTDITEIKPAKVPKSVSGKLSIACTSLQKARAEEHEKIKAAEKAKQQKEQEELMKKDELISRRLQENEDELQRKAEEDRKLRERDESYRNRAASKNQKVTRTNFLKRPITEEELLVDDDDVIAVNEDITVATTMCPICHKHFPNEQIVTHASECDAFSSVSDEINIYQPSTSRAREMDYKCEICNTYRTYDGNNFADHVVKCKEKAEDRRNGIYA